MAEKIKYVLDKLPTHKSWGLVAMIARLHQLVLSRLVGYVIISCALGCGPVEPIQAVPIRVAEQNESSYESTVKQRPDDTAPEMKVKSRKLVFKADPEGLDWAARGSLTKTKTGRWIATYTQATTHGFTVPRLVVVHTSDDEGRTWSEPNSLPDGTSITGAPLRAEHDGVEPARRRLKSRRKPALND